MTNQVIVVIGIVRNEDGTEGQKTLVGIASDVASANALVGRDYLELCVQNNLNPLTNRIQNSLGLSGDTIGYFVDGYAWEFNTINLDEVVAFTL